MRTRGFVTICAFLALGGLLAAHPAIVHAQDAMKSAMVTFALDLHEGMNRSTLTPQQKEQVRNDLKTLREAQKSGDRRTALRAMRNFHQILDSGAFQPQDQQRIKQDLQNLREARKASGGGGGMGMGGMGGMR
jgi:hypothetical protein